MSPDITVGMIISFYRTSLVHTKCIVENHFSPVLLLFTVQGEFIILRESSVPVPVCKLYPQHILLLVSQLGDVLVTQPVFT